ncbi:inner-membrane translocator [Desulfofarcimen acetoxidans DSM 771]|uniref:Inner-membrane translocator n=1 Tax=Desulfofarcimen acetoxidans (strain ATCC 49208 / DSM 771 / KCTC 5769 / VKM B-1644 / 5575) TaxID=485916 RepID=C8W1X3_DESAS|nr:ABC transporter permease [Desulfofarcimen acetoxidans]ACV63594.1 inner-membrane translocator [Desulfofarcimen acetoxidans DSM 771]
MNKNIITKHYTNNKEILNLENINPVPFIFLLLFTVGMFFSEMSLSFVINEVITRFIRDGILVLSLLLPITAGMGLNFAITVGALSAQIVLILAIDLNFYGITGFIIACFFAVVLSVILGYAIGYILNKVKGKEMITTIIIGFLANGVYQLIFLAGYGTFIKPRNTEIILSRGVGVRNMVDLAPYRNILDNIWKINVGDIIIPVFMLIVVLSFCIISAYLMNTRLGQKIRVTGEDMQKAESLGININSVRINAMIISTVIASIGQMIYLQNIGMLNVYTAHLNSDIFSGAALLAGGATIRKAKVRHAVLGIFLFHSLFIVSPQAGQNIFGNAAMGEYFRSFVAYGTLVIALILNKNKLY